MTYIPEIQIETRAAELWQRHSLEAGFDVERLLDDLGLSLVWEDVADDDAGVVLGQLIPERQLVVLNERHIDRWRQRAGACGATRLGTRSGTGSFTPTQPDRGL